MTIALVQSGSTFTRHTSYVLPLRRSMAPSDNTGIPHFGDFSYGFKAHRKVPLKRALLMQRFTWQSISSLSMYNLS